MKPHVKLAKNEQVWHGVSSSYFSIFSLFFYFFFYLFSFLSFLLATSSCRFFLFFFSFSSSCRNSLLGIFNN